MPTLEVKFANAGWDEQSHHAPDVDAPAAGHKTTRVDAGYTYKSGLEGRGAVTYLMHYGPNGTVHFVGLEWVEASLEGRTGGFALQHVGAFTGALTYSDITIVPGSGWGALQGLSGTGRFEHPESAGHPEAFTLTLDYQLG